MLGSEERKTTLMICIKLHDYVNLFENGLQRMFVGYSNQCLT